MMIFFKFLLTIFIGVILHQIRHCFAVPKDSVPFAATDFLPNLNVNVTLLSKVSPFASPQFSAVVSLPSHSLIPSLCGGTIVSSNWILSAAHCVEKYSVQQVGEGVGVPIKSGKEYYEMGRTFLHPDYVRASPNQGAAKNDIALIKYSKQLDLSNLKVINIEAPNLNLISGETVATAACGYFNDGTKSSDVPRLFGARIVPKEEIQKKFKGGVPVLPKMIYAETESTNCLSGSPLYSKSESGEPVLLGIRSSGVNVTNNKTIGVYTEVTQYIPWIQTTMKNNL